MLSKNKQILEREYRKLGSQRAVARKYGCSQTTVKKYMKDLKIPAFPTMLASRGSNSAKGRMFELYVKDHPHFKKKYKDMLFVKGDKNGYDGLHNRKKINAKCSHWCRPIFRTKVKGKHRCDEYVCGWFKDKISRLIARKIWVIPAGKAPFSNITPGIKRGSIYDRYLLSNFRDKTFTREEELRYNRLFAKKYSKYWKKEEGIKYGRQ